MTPPPPDAPTPSTLGAVDLDPWIPKPSTRDIVDHLVQEINAAKQIAEEITSVQSVLDGLMEGTQVDGGFIERVQRELDEKTRRVEELESLLGVEREEKRVLEEKIRVMEDERALRAIVPDIVIKEEDESPLLEKEPVDEETVVDDQVVTTLSIPEAITEPVPEPIIEIHSPPTSPSTAPSSPLQDSSTRSISPISLPSTESSAHDGPTHLLDKIASLESQLATAHKQIEEYKQRLEEASPVLSAVSQAMSAPIGFPFTFTAPSTLPTRSPKSPRLRSRANGSTRHSSFRKKLEAPSETTVVTTAGDPRGESNREFFEGLSAALGVVVLGWVGMWFINRLVERGDRVVK